MESMSSMNKPTDYDPWPVDPQAYPREQRSPARNWVYTDHANDVNVAWINLVNALLRYGERSAPRGQPILELRPVVIELSDPRRSVIAVKDRWLNYSFMVAEWLWIVDGRNDVAMIRFYNKQIGQFSDNGRTFFGAYGPRFREQLARVIKTLTVDPDSRQAVIELWREPPPGGSKDIPCTLSWQFFIRQGKLEMHATMRSSDVWLGLPYDVFNFSMIQQGVAALLGGIQLGKLTLTLHSSHLYDVHLPAAVGVVTSWFKSGSTPCSPEVPLLPALLPRRAAEREMMANAYGRLVPAEPPESPEQTALWNEFLEVLAYRRHRDATRLTGFMAPLIQQQEADRVHKR